MSQFILAQQLACVMLCCGLTSSYYCSQCSFVTPAVADNDMAFLVYDLSAAVFGRGTIRGLGRGQSVK